MSDTILKVENLVTKFKSSGKTVTAINGVDFSIERGKVLGIVGESGCGKSVTSLSIMGLLDRKRTEISGNINYQGDNLLQYNDKQMQKIRGNRISMIFQEPMTALNPIFTIGFQLKEVLALHKGIKNKKEAKQISLEMLQQVGIPRPEKVLEEYPHQLSGGMRQRVMIAMSLLCNPELLIADEPTTALDVTIQAQVLELITGLKNQFNMGVLFITHDLGVIAEMADEVLVMYAGKVVEQAPVQELFDNPLHPYTRGLLSSRAVLFHKGEKLHCIPGKVPGLTDMPIGCAFHPRCNSVCDECRAKVPELKEVSHRHFVRCFPVQKGDLGYGI
ncbi:ABC transporter ATP-binding protein [Anaerocolumna cellulosilytica]|uniref:ABC transporter ATP-binding protein n=1 Tax=Anaerocolumna cellulosilytica TaxID=433286 RepID=A0A6S6R481_9FIRM|nr:ABC transporter ATP-binding protein [Anaerocolumna cellulosilytica]MBB5194755.1 oligopeptide/dipeptide ABC transporter ATP-binding protein [Anaerocolumna cellulosilytica]BCJ94282.1 ABC transporter ATP-binding protein [Anaerocolumna cellulosilytica]